MQNNLIQRTARNLEDKTDLALTWMLIGVGLFYISVGILGHNKAIKSIVLAYGILP